MPEDSPYGGICRELLMKIGARVGDRVRIHVKRPGSQETIEGLLMPRSKMGGDETYIVVKLNTGYNVGVLVDQSTNLEIVGKGIEPHFTRPETPSRKPGLPKVTIMSTGGTIVSRVDYGTGAVKSALDAEDLYSVVPELANIAEVDARILFSIFSENIGPTIWSKIAESVRDAIQQGTRGVVVAHGTDTLAYTSAALCFALNNPPVPVVLVGAQRSSDRPSSDAATNLLAATDIAARAPFAEVVIAMHDWVSDETVDVHRGTKVRKCHTSRRDAFRSINTDPIAHYDLKQHTLQMNTEQYAPRHDPNGWAIKPRFDPNVLLLKFYPSLSAGIIDWATATGYKGIVLEGTGLGHVSESLYTALERAIKDGLVVGMCSQCISGRVQMDVYSTGRELQRIGVIPLYDMLSETAVVKMMWAFGSETEPENVKRIMQVNVSNEFSDRRVLEDEQHE